MHKYRLKTLLNFSGLGLQLIARRCVLGVFLLSASYSSADCERSVYPKSASPELLVSADLVAELLAAEKNAASLCSARTQDLAQLYFWGGPSVTANLARSYDYALRSRKAERWGYELRILHSAFVLADLDRSFSPEEALRHFQREIDSGVALRRDKALAVLNQLSSLLPYSTTGAVRVFKDRAFRQPFPDVDGVVVLAQHENYQRVLVSNAQGMPQLAWMPVSGAHEIPRTEGAIDGLYVQRRSTAGATGAEDSRQQVWQAPRSAPRTGVLLSRFRQRDGSLFESRCTASQLSGQWLISAAHCLFAPDGSQQILSLRYIASPLVLANAIAVSRVWVHREHDPVDQATGNVASYSGSDIALFKLAQPLPINNPPILAVPLASNPVNWVDSFAYPSDKARHSLWFSRCRASLWQRGEQALSDIYSLDCFSHEGQSGAALLQTISGTPHIIGVLSSRIHNEKINKPIFAALNAGLIADIGRVIANDAEIPVNFRAYNVATILANVAPELLP
ncbi:hypothetical protein HNQ57_001723 [Zhongshania antarctica]|uniref:Peptidase S1 domain-containing protein n=1 Tax=Zhongshania antarctica TaxID=641702 RepID=A0A840R4H5_9GAMM|nr:trypsin-like serine protease [Zhongshania antarctica]MBB5187454.1 hypothetical protein [Zhongshania antarctica]